MSGKTIWFTGLSGSGKSTLAKALKDILCSRNQSAVLLDGDILRSGLNRDLGFSAADRAENIRRAGEIAKILNDLGHIVFAAFITPVESLRKAVRSIFDPSEFVEIYLDCPVSVCEARDPKGLYAKARQGLIKEFTGISAPFQLPKNPDLVVKTDRFSSEESVDLVLAFIERKFPEIRSGACASRQKKASARKVAVIGLDCAPPSIVFNDAYGLTNIKSLMKHGVWGSLKSTDPPITIPAWTTITTGYDPGELGLYGFRNRLSHNKYDLVTVNSTHVSCPRVWDRLEKTGMRSILIGVPQTFPAAPHSGITVSGFPAVENSEDFCYPRGLMGVLSCLGDGDYLADVKDFRSAPRERLLSQLYSMVDSRFKVAQELLLKEEWDFFMMVEIATDRLHHAFWSSHEGRDGKRDSGNSGQNPIPEFYKYLDDKIGEILGFFDDDTTVIIISDHGARSSTGGFCINEWLIRKGLLTLKEPPASETKFSEELIDWDKTLVWSEGGYYARIFMNVEGREPRGIIKKSEYESFRDYLRTELEVTSEPGGHKLFNTVLKPEDLYRDVKGIPPDLMVYFDSLNRRSIGSVGMKDILTKGAIDGLDSCNHDPEGIFIATRLRDLRSGAIRDVQLTFASCPDITPTILAEYGLGLSRDLSGSIISIGGDVDATSARSEIHETFPLTSEDGLEDRGFTNEEEEIVKKRLSDLGYI